MTKFKIDILREHEITALLELQKANLAANLDTQTIDSQGFVSFVYTHDIIKGMMREEPQIIVKEGNLIIGYALTTTLQYGETMTLMKPLVEKSRNLTFDGKRISQSWYYIMGQICVRAGYRSMGVFEALYKGHQQFLSSDYDYVITEIADTNQRSLAAHKRIGFETIHQYYDEISQKNWHVVLWNFK